MEGLGAGGVTTGTDGDTVKGTLLLDRTKAGAAGPVTEAAGTRCSGGRGAPTLGAWDDAFAGAVSGAAMAGGTAARLPNWILAWDAISSTAECSLRFEVRFPARRKRVVASIRPLAMRSPTVRALRTVTRPPFASINSYNGTFF